MSTFDEIQRENDLKNYMMDFNEGRPGRVKTKYEELVGKYEGQVMRAYLEEVGNPQYAQTGKMLNYSLSLNPGLIGMDKKSIVSDPARAMARAALYKLAEISIAAGDMVYNKTMDPVKAEAQADSVINGKNPFDPNGNSLISGLTLGGMFGRTVSALSYANKQGEATTTTAFTNGERVLSDLDKNVDIGNGLGAFLQNATDKTLIGSFVTKAIDYATGNSPSLFTDYRAAAMQENLYSGDNSMLPTLARHASSLLGYAGSIAENVYVAKKFGGTPGIFGLSVAKSALGQYEYATGTAERFDSTKFMNSMLYDSISTLAGLTLSNVIVTGGSAALGNPDFTNALRTLYKDFGNSALLKMATAPLINATLNTVCDVTIDYSLHSLMKNNMGMNFTQTQLTRFDLDGLTPQEKMSKIGKDFLMRSAMTMGSGIYRSMLSSKFAGNDGFLSNQWLENNFGSELKSLRSTSPLLTNFAAKAAAFSWNVFPSNVKAINDMLTDPRALGAGTFVDQIKSGKMSPSHYMTLWMAAEAQTNSLYRWVTTPLGGINADRLMASLSGTDFSAMVKKLGEMTVLDINNDDQAKDFLKVINDYVDDVNKVPTGLTQNEALDHLRKILSVTTLVNTSSYGGAIDQVKAIVNGFNTTIEKMATKVKGLNSNTSEYDKFFGEAKSILETFIDVETGQPTIKHGLGSAHIPQQLLKDLSAAKLVKVNTDISITPEDVKNLQDSIDNDEYGVSHMSTFIASLNVKYGDTGSETYKTTLKAILKEMATSIEKGDSYTHLLQRLGNVSANLITSYSDAIVKLVKSESVSTDNKAIGIQRMNEEIWRLFESFERYSDDATKARAKGAFEKAIEATESIRNHLSNAKVGDMLLNDMVTLQEITFNTKYAKSLINPFLSMSKEQLQGLGIDHLLYLSGKSLSQADIRKVLRILNVRSAIPTWSKELNGLIIHGDDEVKYTQDDIIQGHMAWHDFVNKDDLTVEGNSVSLDYKNYVFLKVKQYMDAAYLRDSRILVGKKSHVDDAVAFLNAAGFEIDVTGANKTSFEDEGKIVIKNVSDAALTNKDTLIPLMHKLTDGALMSDDEFSRIGYSNGPIFGNTKTPGNPGEIDAPTNISFSSYGKVKNAAEVADVVEHFQQFSSSFIHDVRALASTGLIREEVENVPYDSDVTKIVGDYMKALDPTFRITGANGNSVVSTIISRALHTTANEIQYKIDEINSKLSLSSEYGNSNISERTNLGNGHYAVTVSIKQGIPFDKIDSVMKDNGFELLLDTGSTVQNRTYVILPKTKDDVDYIVKNITDSAKQRVNILSLKTNKDPLLNADNKHLSYSWLVSLMGIKDQAAREREIQTSTYGQHPDGLEQINGLFRSYDSRGTADTSSYMSLINKTLYGIVKFTKGSTGIVDQPELKPTKFNEIIPAELESTLGGLIPKYEDVMAIMEKAVLGDNGRVDFDDEVDALVAGGKISQNAANAMKSSLTLDSNGEITFESAANIGSSLNALFQKINSGISPYLDYISRVHSEVNDAPLIGDSVTISPRSDMVTDQIAGLERAFRNLPPELQSDTTISNYHAKLLTYLQSMKATVDADFVKSQKPGGMSSLVFGTTKGIVNIDDISSKDAARMLIKAMLTDGISYTIGDDKIAKRFGGLNKDRYLTEGEMEAIRKKLYDLGVTGTGSSSGSLIQIVAEAPTKQGPEPHAGTMYMDTKLYALLQHYLEPGGITMRMGESLIKVSVEPKDLGGHLIELHTDDMKYVSPLLSSKIVEIPGTNRFKVDLKPSSAVALILSGITLHSNVKNTMTPSNRSSQLGSFNVAAYALSTYLGFDPKSLEDYTDPSKGTMSEYRNNILAKIRRQAQIATYYGKLIPSDSGVTALDGASVVNGSLDKIHTSGYGNDNIVSYKTTAPFTADYSLRALYKMAIGFIDADKTKTLADYNVGSRTIKSLLKEISDKIDGMYKTGYVPYTTDELKQNATSILDFLSTIDESGIMKTTYKDKSGNSKDVFVTTGIRYSIDNTAHVVPLFVTGTRNLDQGASIGWSHKFTTVSNGDYDKDAVQVLPIDKNGLRLFLSTERNTRTRDYIDNDNKLITDLIYTQQEHFQLYTRQMSASVKGGDTRPIASEDTKLLPQFIAKNAAMWNAFDSLIGKEFTYQNIPLKSYDYRVTPQDLEAGKGEYLKGQDPANIKKDERTIGNSRYWLNPNAVVLVSGGESNSIKGANVLGSIGVKATQLNTDINGDVWRVTVGEIPGLNPLNQIVILSKISNIGLDTNVRMFEVPNSEDVTSFFHTFIGDPHFIPPHIKERTIGVKNLMLGYRDSVSNKISNTFVNFASSKSGDLAIKAATGKENINDAANVIAELNSKMIAATSTHIIAVLEDKSLVLVNAPHSYISSNREALDSVYAEFGKYDKANNNVLSTDSGYIRFEFNNPIADELYLRAVSQEPLIKMADSYMDGSWNKNENTPEDIEKFKGLILDTLNLKNSKDEAYYRLPYNVRIVADAYEAANKADGDAMLAPRKVLRHLDSSALDEIRNRYNNNLLLLSSNDIKAVGNVYTATTLIDRLISLIPVSSDIQRSLLNYVDALQNNIYLSGKYNVSNQDELVTQLYNEINQKSNGGHITLAQVKLFVSQMDIKVGATKLAAAESINSLGESTLYKSDKSIINSNLESRQVVADPNDKTIILGNLTTITVGKKNNVASINGLFAAAIGLTSDTSNVSKATNAIMFTTLIDMFEGDYVPVMAKMVSDGLTSTMAKGLAESVLSRNSSGVNYKLDFNKVSNMEMPVLNEGSQLYLQSYSSKRGLINANRIDTGC